MTHYLIIPTKNADDLLQPAVKRLEVQIPIRIAGLRGPFKKMDTEEESVHFLFRATFVFSHIVQKRFSQMNEDIATDALAFVLESSAAARDFLLA